MSRFRSKQQLLDELRNERAKLEELLVAIPDDDKHLEIMDGMSVKDVIAHRTEWGRMVTRWYEAARAGEVPAVPSEKYKWNQLKQLNAEIHTRFRDAPLQRVQAEFTRVHDDLDALVQTMSEEELFSKHYYAFTGSSDLASYVNSATAAHYRSARKFIRPWWLARQRRAQVA